MKSPFLNKKHRIIISVCILLACLWIGLRRDGKVDSPEAQYSIPRHIEYNYTLQNKTNQLTKNAEFWSYAPANETPTQQCIRLEASHPHRLIKDGLGNQILRFAFRELPPYATKIINIQADLMLSDTPNKSPVKDPRPYLQAEKYCESDDPEIRRLAEKLKASKTTETVENIFNWVADNVQYTGYVKNARGALYALKNRKGDCTEFMYLFIALCRANDIPARGIGGYVITANAVLKPNEYHNWAEFYDDGVWRIADPQRKVFMRNPSHYIAMRVIGNSTGNPMGKDKRFRLDGIGLNVKMNK